MSQSLTVPLTTGGSAPVVLPMVGLGLYRVRDDQAAELVQTAFELGYRGIDTAQLYDNEEGVGRALAGSAMLRDQIFVTSKLGNDDHGYNPTMRAFDATMRRLGPAMFDYLDLYLIHWPCPDQDQYVASWQAMRSLRQSGQVRAVGVSNFDVDQLRRLADETGEMPSLNQVKLNPWNQQRSLREFHAEHGIVTQAWAPLARAGGRLEDPVIVQIAAEQDRTPAQVVLRWHLQHSIVVIPKSGSPVRLAENIDLFDFELDQDQMSRVDGLDKT